MAVSTGAAIVGGALIGGAASIMGGQAQASAAEAAAESSAAASAYATETQLQMFEQTREDQEPWRIAGEKALQTIQDMPDFQFTPADFEAFKDPAYEFRMEEGINALDRSAAARGRVLSGAQDKAVTRYGQQLASEEYTNAFNRAMATRQTNLATQQSLAGVGQTATNVLAQAGQATAGNIATIAQTGAAAQGTAAMQGGQATAQMYGNVAQTANQALGNYLLYQNTAPAVTVPVTA